MSTQDIAARFHEERDEITEYIGFMRINASLHERHLVKYNDALIDAGLNPAPLISLDPNILVPLIKASIEAAGNLVGIIHDQYDTEPYYRQASALTDSDKSLFEMIIRDIIPKLPEHADDDAIRRSFRAGLIARSQRPQRYTMKVFLEHLPEFFRYRHHENTMSALTFILITGPELLLRIKASTPGSTTHIHRQGFILLMTAFDATMFDLTRIAIQQNFFHFARHLGKDEQNKEKKTLVDMADAGSFDKLRNDIVEEQLKRRYLKDIISLLDKAGVRLADEMVECNPGPLP